MRNYEAISNRIMERGDRILEERQNRTERIKQISYTISGLCAAAIVCLGLKSTSLFNNHDNFNNRPVPAVTQEVTSCNTTTNVNTETTTSENISDTTTKTVSSVSTTVSETTEPVTETAIISEVTGSENISEVTDIQLEITEKNTEISSEPDIQSIFSESSVTFSMKTTPKSILAPKNCGILGQSTDSTVSTKYEKESTVISENEIGELIGISPVQINSGDSIITMDMEVYMISGIDIHEAVAVKLPDTNIYYKFNCQDSLNNIF